MGWDFRRLYLRLPGGCFQSIAGTELPPMTSGGSFPSILRICATAQWICKSYIYCTAITRSWSFRLLLILSMVDFGGAKKSGCSDWDFQLQSQQWIHPCWNIIFTWNTENTRNTVYYVKYVNIREIHIHIHECAVRAKTEVRYKQNLGQWEHDTTRTTTCRYLALRL